MILHQCFIRESCLIPPVRAECKNILLVKVGIAYISVAGNDGLEHAVGVGLARDLNRGNGIEGGVAYRRDSQAARGSD